MSEKSTISNKLTFSGHDTFHCRNLWLKKGYDFVQKGRKFSEDDAVIALGVGKNMVSAIYFWMKSFGLINKEGDLTDIAHYIFASDGKDPFLEDEATLWLLHYYLVTQENASIYSLIFNDLRKEKIEFTKENFFTFAERKVNESGFSQLNNKTATKDFDVLLKMYIRTAEQNKDKEDTFSGLLTDLNLIQMEKQSGNLYSILNENRSSLPEEILLYSILDNNDFQTTIDLDSIFRDRNQASTIFAITKNAIMEKLELIIDNNNYKKYGITLNNHAGIKQLQFISKPNKFEVLNNYYGK